jgi:hypothetical protein
MTCSNLASALLLCTCAPSLFAAPMLTVTPGAMQGNNFVWDVSVTPDLAITSTNETPVAVELGFRLTGAPLLTATNINPAEFTIPNPGEVIFGWETLDPAANNRPVGLQTNTATDEIFVAYGSEEFTTPGAKPFLQIVAQGPANGGGSLSSSIEWLGVYAQGHGRIAQLVNGQGENFDIFAGTATQAVPEPACAILLALTAVALGVHTARRKKK